MISRREWLRLSLGTGAALVVPGCARRPEMLGDTAASTATSSPSQASVGQLITRAIPSSGERIPVVGLGSSATFSQVARTEDVTALREVLRTLVAMGGRVFDTAPGYGASEETAGRIVQELGIADKLFWATKVNVARQGSVDPAAVRDQIETSFRRVGKRPIDLIQVHNLGEVPTQLGILRQMKQEGRIRYIGVTTTFERQYEELVSIMRNEQLDFIGIDYAVDNREVEMTILPLARERKIGVLAYAPFGRTRLWRRVAGREVPAWDADFDARTWAQFFLKFVVSNPDITATTPATSQARNMADNLGGAMGRLPNAEQRRRMIELVDALPAAPGS